LGRCPIVRQYGAHAPFVKRPLAETGDLPVGAHAGSGGPEALELGDEATGHALLVGAALEEVAAEVVVRG
jgi:hypothetical protein